MRRFSLILILALLSGCQHLPTNSGHSATTLADEATIGSRDSAAITRQEVLQIAQAYARYEWRATVTNTFHGVDASGLHVDTPDVKWWVAAVGISMDESMLAFPIVGAVIALLPNLTKEYRLADPWEISNSCSIS